VVVDGGSVRDDAGAQVVADGLVDAGVEAAGAAEHDVAEPAAGLAVQPREQAVVIEAGSVGEIDDALVGGRDEQELGVRRI
jgi:hypothetical protein